MTDPPKRPRIVLPSFKEVQAAQRTSKAAPNLFQSRNATSSSEASNLGQGKGVLADNYVQPAQIGPRFIPRQQDAAASVRSPANATGSSATPVGMHPPQNAAHMPAGPSGNVSAAGQAFNPPAGPMVDYSAYNASPNAILVSRRQEGNPLLKHIRHVRWVFADIVPDYIMGADICALFLSMRFHLLKPDYIHHRIKELQRSFRLRVLMCCVDIDDVIEPLQQITRAAILNGVTLICGWSPEECARYLETFKVYETKPADSIKGHTDEDYLSRLNGALTTIRGINRTDVLTLGGTFKTAASIMQASMKDLASCPGIGPTKVQRLYDTFHEPFRKDLKTRQTQTTKLTFAKAGSQAMNQSQAQNTLESLDVMSDIQDSDDDDEIV